MPPDATHDDAAYYELWVSTAPDSGFAATETTTAVAASREYAAGNEFDIYKAWAAAIVHGRRTERPNRRCSAGLINLRPECDGHITGYSGVEEVFRKWGEWIMDSHFPPPGSPTQPVEAGYMANAWLRMRYPDYDDLREILMSIGRTVRVHAR